MPGTQVQRILDTVHSRDRQGRSLPEVLCAECAAALPVSGVGLALMSERGHEGLVAATDGPASMMEELQFSLGEGPCLEASGRAHPVLQPSLRLTGPARWPGFAPAALDQGIEAVFAFPLHIGGIRLGVLDLYRSEPGPLEPDELSKALAFADAATRVLLHLQDQMPTDGGLHPDLGDRSSNRREVHQATGMISVQAAVGLAEALLLLRARAFSRGVSVFDIAREVVSRDLRFAPETSHHE